MIKPQLVIVIETELSLMAVPKSGNAKISKSTWTVFHASKPGNKAYFAEQGSVKAFGLQLTWGLCSESAFGDGTRWGSAKKGILLEICRRTFWFHQSPNDA